MIHLCTGIPMHLCTGVYFFPCWPQCPAYLPPPLFCKEYQAPATELDERVEHPTITKSISQWKLSHLADLMSGDSNKAWHNWHAFIHICLLSVFMTKKFIIIILWYQLQYWKVSCVSQYHHQKKDTYLEIISPRSCEGSVSYSSCGMW